jgi:C4-dicarboxylate-specific signal transduction histidine kinase
VEIVDNSFVVDWRQLRRFGLSEARLPVGADVLFREPTAWERYRTAALATLGLIAAESLLIGLLLLERRRRKLSQELNRAVLASLSAQIAILDRDGTIIRVNEAWRDGARFGEVESHGDAFVGWNYLEECRRAEARGSEEAGKVRRGVEAVLERREWPFRHEYRWSAPDEHAYEIFVDRLQVSEGGAIVTHLDITDRRVAERRAEETRRQVAHMGRLALVGELSATMSHELRQPLAAIRANAEAGARLLTLSPPDLREVREILQSIVADDKRAADVIEGVRKLLRKDEAFATTVDLNQVCQESVRLLQHEAELRQTRLELSLSAAHPTVAGDPVQLQQVLLNLMLNGLEAASTSTTERAVVIHTETNADGVEVTVHDSGPGLSASVHPRLFDPFFSTKTGGLGLGLVIVRSIVERHNGRVRAENHSLGGALFRVRLPAASA